jgi:hypothetical protein
MGASDASRGLQGEMSNTPEKRFGPVESCLDYQSYVYNIDPDLSPALYAASCRQLMTLGRADEEKMGVVYVRGPWGFLVIPHFGYPKLRVSFYHDTPKKERSDILSLICAAFEKSDAVLEQGDLDE